MISYRAFTRGLLELNWKFSQLFCSFSLSSIEQRLNNTDCWYLWKEKERRSQCGISWGLLGGRSALVYSVQLNKLECQEHNASSILWKKKKKLPFFSLWRCWAAHYSWAFQCVWKHWINAHTGAPFRPPSLLKKKQGTMEKHSARQRS